MPDFNSLVTFLERQAERPATPNWAADYAAEAAKWFGVDAGQFEAALKLASGAHHEYELGLGHKDEAWPAWYARAMLA